jgi:uncharacterized protein (UPF0128 family)
MHNSFIQPVNSGVLDEIRVIRPQRGFGHFLEKFFGQVGQCCPEFRGSFRFEMSLSSKKLSNINVCESCFFS